MDCIYYNGKIITMEKENKIDELSNSPEAVLVSNGVIRAVGILTEIKKLAKKNCKFIDLKGKCLMPSFIDPHGHIVMNGQMAMCAYLGDCESFDDIISTLKTYISDKRITSKNAVLGFGYDHNFLKEKSQPDKRVLDQVSSEIPIMILHVSAHLACVNSVALSLAGINAETTNPEGGVIGRMDDGKEPSGYLEESGMMLVQKSVSSKIKPDFITMIKGIQENYIKNGITTVQDGATTVRDFGILKFLAALNLFKIDVVAYPLLSADGEKLFSSNRKRVNNYINRLKIGGFKLVLDGSPQGRSAWMSKPYLGGEEGYCGYPWLSDDQVEQYIKVALRQKQQLLAHCNGDAASEQYLRIYEKVRDDIDNKDDLRPVMIHCQTVRNDQLDRMAKLKMIASIFVGHVFYWGDVHILNFGVDRGNHISPVKDAMDRGIVVNFHQDTPVTKPDMMHSVWAAVNRISREGNIVGADQKIDVYDALKAITINGAYQYFEESSKGSITTGKRADLVILDKSPLEVLPEELRDITVLETIKDGKSIFTRIDCV